MISVLRRVEVNPRTGPYVSRIAVAGIAGLLSGLLGVGGGLLFARLLTSLGMLGAGLRPLTGPGGLSQDRR